MWYFLIATQIYNRPFIAIASLLQIDVAGKPSEHTSIRRENLTSLNVKHQKKELLQSVYSKYHNLSFTTASNDKSKM